MTTQDRNYMTGRDEEFERARLTAQSNLFDARTFEELGSIGVTRGWNCLDLGAGTGSVTRWLLDRVGAEGAVVAVDLDTTSLSQIDVPNLSIRSGDATTMDFGDGVFDLVVARLFFEHIPERTRVLADCVRALKPGGWLWVYDADYTPIRAVGSPDIEARWQRLSHEVFPFGAAVGQTDVTWAAGLVAVFDDLGLQRVFCNRTERVQPAGGPNVENMRRILLQRLNLLETGSDERQAYLEDVNGVFDDPALRLYGAAGVTAWGCKGA